jgi:hypothetical protein
MRRGLGSATARCRGRGVAGGGGLRRSRNDIAQQWLGLGIFGLIVLGVGLLLGVPSAGAQVPPLVGRGPYDPSRVGIPSDEQIIDVSWSGDRRGEFINIGLLPPAFRLAAPVPAPTRVPPRLSPLANPTWVPRSPVAIPTPVFPTVEPSPAPEAIPTPIPRSPVAIPTIVLPSR